MSIFFIYQSTLTHTDEQGAVTDENWKQAENVLDNIKSGRSFLMKPFHGGGDGLYEIKVNRRTRLIFEKISIENNTVYLLIKFEVDHNHKKLIRAYENSSKKGADFDFKSLDPRMLNEQGYTLLISDKTKVLENNTSSATAAAGGAVSAYDGIYYNGRFTQPDKKQKQILSGISSSGIYLYTAPAGAGKTFCSAGLMQRLYEDANECNHGEEDEGEIKPHHIAYITQSEKLVRREKENFAAWDPDFANNPAVILEFFPYDFIAFRVLTQQPSAQYEITEAQSRKKWINPDYLKWKKENVITKHQVINQIALYQKALKGRPNKTTAQMAVAEIRSEDLYRELLLNSALLNQALTHSKNEQAYYEQGVNKSIIPREDNNAQRMVVIELYRDLEKQRGNKIHLPFCEFALPETDKADDVIFDEAQDLSSQQVENMISIAKGRRVFLGDNQQALDGKSILYSIREKAINRGKATNENENESEDDEGVNLKVNYRTPPRIIQFLNPLIRLKHSLVGLAEKDDYQEVSAPSMEWESENARRPGQIRFSESSLDSQKSRVEQIDGTRPDQAVVTFASEEKIPEIQKLYNTYLVLMPHEIKGLEFKKITIHGAFEDARCKAIDFLLPQEVDRDQNKKAGRKEKNKEIPGEQQIIEWMNTFYVCATRATESLIIEKPQHAEKHPHRKLIAHLVAYANEDILHHQAFVDSQHTQASVSATAAASGAVLTQTHQKQADSLSPEVKKQCDAIAFAECIKLITTMKDVNLLDENPQEDNQEALQSKQNHKKHSEIKCESMSRQCEIVLALLNRFYQHLDSSIVKAFLDSDFESATLESFRGFAHAKYVLCNLKKLNSTGMTFDAFWNASGIFLSESVEGTIVNVFNRQIWKEANLPRYVNLIAALLEESSNQIVMAKNEKLSTLDKQFIKERLIRIAQANKCTELLSPKVLPKKQAVQTTMVKAGNAVDSAKSSQISQSATQWFPFDDALKDEFKRKFKTLHQILEYSREEVRAQVINAIFSFVEQDEGVRKSFINALSAKNTSGETSLYVMFKVEAYIERFIELSKSFKDIREGFAQALPIQIKNNFGALSLIAINLPSSLGDLFELVGGDQKMQEAFANALTIEDRHHVTALHLIAQNAPAVAVSAFFKLVASNRLIRKAFVNALAIVDNGDVVMPLHFIAQKASADNLETFFDFVRRDEEIRNVFIKNLLKANCNNSTVLHLIAECKTVDSLGLFLKLVSANQEEIRQKEIQSVFVKGLLMRDCRKSTVLHVIAERASRETRSVFLNLVAANKEIREAFVEGALMKDYEGWPVLHIMIQFASTDCLAIFAKLVASHEKIREVFIKWLCTGNSNNWTGLHVIAECISGNSLGVFFKLMASHENIRKTFVKGVLSQDDRMCTVFHLIVEYAPKDTLTVFFGLVVSDLDIQSKFIQGLLMKEEKGFTVLHQMMRKFGDFLSDFFKLLESEEKIRNAFIQGLLIKDEWGFTVLHVIAHFAPANSLSVFFKLVKSKEEIAKAFVKGLFIENAVKHTVLHLIAERGPDFLREVPQIMASEIQEKSLDILVRTLEGREFLRHQLKTQSSSATVASGSENEFLKILVRGKQIGEWLSIAEANDAKRQAMMHAQHRLFSPGSKQSASAVPITVSLAPQHPFD
jgi:hypothetical protein